VRGFLKTFLPRFLGPFREPAKVLYDLVPPSIRYGRSYSEALALLEASERWDLSALRAYQDRMLRRLVRHCYTNVPYYRKIFLETGLRPEDINTVDDLKKLPLLTKELVRKHKHELLATNFSLLKKDPDATSGSTGMPLDFFVDNTARAMEMALALRHLQWLGYEDGDRVAEIKEDRFYSPDRVFRYFPGSKHLKFSFFRVDDSRLQRTVEALEEFKPAFIKAYPSSLFVLTRWMDRHKKKIPPPRYIITSSENLYHSTREQAEAVLKAPVIDWYGQNEKVATAFQCSVGRGYHIQMEQAIVEFVPARSGPTEMVGTALHSLGMPFIRYRTGDRAVDGGEECPCGRKHPVMSEVIGREWDYIVTPEKNLIAPVAMDYALYHLEEIKESQIVQEDINTLKIRLVPWETISGTTKQKLLSEVRSHLGSLIMNVVIEEVDHIPRTARGKKPFIVSHLQMDRYI
jgi:phenylacetate-CoA ligase